MMKKISVIKISMLALVMCLFFAGSAFSEVSVYDANGQYLGVYMASFNSNGTFTKNVIEIFNPSLENTIFIQKDNIVEEEIYFDSDGCSGKAYVHGWGTGSGPMYSGAMFPVIIRAEGCQDKYYVTIDDDIKTIGLKSFMHWSCQCEQLTWDAGHYLSEVSEFPKSSFPFTMPFALPLKMKYTSGGDINGDGKTGLEEAINALQITSGLKNPGPPANGTK